MSFWQIVSGLLAALLSADVLCTNTPGLLQVAWSLKTSSVPWYGSVGTITVVGLTELVQSSHVRFCTAATATAAKSLQSWLTLCDSRDSSPPGFPFPGILQARTLAWVAISFSNAWKWKGSHSVVSDSSRPHGLGLLCPWDFPDKSTGVGCHCLFHW